MTSLVTTFLERRSDLWDALIQHLSISLAALAIAMIIAIPLAIWVQHHKTMSEVLLQITSVLQTIPSLALLGLMIPIVGIGTLPAIIALVVYALLPIFQNTYIGINEIDPSLEEAADAFGMSRMQKLFRIELPIAMPVIISGIRSALVLIIGTATLAALIGAGGLGTFILLGIDRADTSLTLIGAISAALLAIVLSLVIRWFQRVKVRTTLIALGAVLLLGIGYFVPPLITANHQAKEITIAGKLGSEPDILIHMYQDLIRQDNPKIKINLKPDFGQTSFLFDALKHDQIDIYPEFTGTVLQTLVKGESVSGNASAQTIYQKSKAALKQQDKLDFLKPMQYNNTYALAVKQSFANKYHLKNISDLSRVQSQLKGGMTLEFIDRSDGLPGIKKKYGLSFPVQGMQPKLRYEAINKGRVNIVDAYATDSELTQYHLVALKDDKHQFPTYQGAPLMSEKLAKENPGVVASLNQLAGKISERDMSRMNYLVNVKDESAAKVAKDYLRAHHLLKAGD